MSKRRNDNGQLTKDEVELLNNSDDDYEPGKGFEKANETELAGRRIVKAKRAAPSQPKTLIESQSSNPFASLGVNFLTSKPQNTVGPSTLGVDNSKQPTLSFDAKLAATPNDSTTKLETYEDKMKKLNSCFVSWAVDQLATNPLAIWSNGVTDYIKHAENIAKNFPKSISQTAPSVSDSQPVKQPPPVTSTQTITENVTPPVLGMDKSSTEAPKKNWLAFPSSQFSSESTKPFGDLNTVSADSKTKQTAFPTFNLPQTSNNPVTSALPPFQFGKSSATTAPAFSLPAFNPPAFGTLPLTTGPALFPPLANPFGSLTAPTFGVQAGGDGEDGEGGDDEGEPILEPEKALRNENDKDEIIFEATSKLMRFDKGGKEWKDMGKGNFRVTRNPDTKKPRMLMRNLTGKIMFNAGFFTDMKFEKVKGGVKFSAVTASSESSEGELQLYIIKVKESEVANCLNKLVETAKTV